ncbi:hypothetical protein PHYSODRAFT_339731 [Phytophthora sojae]|uniref:Uncharacterized protein n=1 Tax=Phytophthora sojae (strain P6497) TaxID=1094619 RepID=G5A7F3_PHYSP|nr:hypothetical protein PHYSODRAFT_339731 [Phytophthora sojae]EGZ07832.1 hypothetical protein PHYSODRAFT_339731 [Phytophthora sojae]|eukprot:XP_009536004.1 hypothetical protein PHYSODRAFT_339731 [Phytophthora sojae]
MAPPSRAFADAAAAALRALQCSGPGAVDLATDTSGRRPARQGRSVGAPAPIAAGAVPPAPAADTAAKRQRSTVANSRAFGHVGNSRGVPPTAVVLGEQQMLELARLVVGVARLPPARVNAALDHSLQAATNVGEVLAAAVAPPRLPLAEADELVALRRENDRLQAELSDAKDKLAEEMNLRTKSDYFLVSANSECDQALDLVQDMRVQLSNASAQLMQANVAIAHHADVTQSLEKRTLVAEADSAAAVRRNTQLHERISASLVTYNTQLERLRKQLADHDRANVIPARIQALTDENNSLRRANSILRRHSAAHGLDVDTLVLASAGISAAEIDWNLLGLSPPTVTVESPRHDESSSEEGEESKTTDVPMAESTEATSTPAASVGASAAGSANRVCFRR